MPSLASDPDEKAFPELPIEERRALLRARHPVWTPLTVSTQFERAVDEFGDAPFLVTDQETWSYGEVWDKADRVARALIARGIGPGDRVALVMANYPEFVPLKMGIARTGATAVPLNYRYRAAELAYVLAQSESRILITMSRYAHVDFLSALDEIAPGWRSGSQSVFPVLESVVVLPVGTDDAEGLLTVEELVASAPDRGRAQGTTSPEGISDIIYTSGTTGHPKGVVMTHDGILRTAYASALSRALPPGLRILSALPCYHSFGYIEGMLTATFVGGSFVPRVSFSAEDTIEAVERHRVQDMLCVPTMAIALVQYPGLDRRDVSSLRSMLLGAAAAPGWLWGAVRRDLGIAELCTGYGMTEAGGSTTQTRPDDPEWRLYETVGAPKDAGVAATSPSGMLADYATVDATSGELLPRGQEGVLVSRGPGTMLGYWRNPEETSVALRDGWLHSGDIGVVREDGYIELTGREKDQYKSGGELVSPREVEEVLAAHDSISQAHVFGAPDPVWGERGCAVVVPAPGVSLTPEDVIAICRAELADFKVPKQVRVMSADNLPRTLTGKVQKRLLADLFDQS